MSIFTYYGQNNEQAQKKALQKAQLQRQPEQAAPRENALGVEGNGALSKNAAPEPVKRKRPVLNALKTVAGWAVDPIARKSEEELAEIRKTQPFYQDPADAFWAGMAIDTADAMMGNQPQSNALRMMSDARMNDPQTQMQYLNFQTAQLELDEATRQQKLSIDKRKALQQLQDMRKTDNWSQMAPRAKLEAEADIYSNSDNIDVQQLAMPIYEKLATIDASNLRSFGTPYDQAMKVFNETMSQIPLHSYTPTSAAQFVEQLKKDINKHIESKSTQPFFPDMSKLELDPRYTPVTTPSGAVQMVPTRGDTPGKTVLSSEEAIQEKVLSQSVQDEAKRVTDKADPKNKEMIDKLARSYEGLESGGRHRRALKSLYGNIEGRSLARTATSFKDQDAVDADQRLRSLLNQLSLESVELLKGQGQITENERAMLAAAVSLLSSEEGYLISDDELDRQLDEIGKTIDRALVRWDTANEFKTNIIDQLPMGESNQTPIRIPRPSEGS